MLRTDPVTQDRRLTDTPLLMMTTCKTFKNELLKIYTKTKNINITAPESVVVSKAVCAWVWAASEEKGQTLSTMLLPN